MSAPHAHARIIQRFLLGGSSTYVVQVKTTPTVPYVSVCVSAWSGHSIGHAVAWSSPGRPARSRRVHARKTPSRRRPGRAGCMHCIGPRVSARACMARRVHAPGPRPRRRPVRPASPACPTTRSASQSHAASACMHPAHRSASFSLLACLHACGCRLRCEHNSNTARPLAQLNNEAL